MLRIRIRMIVSFWASGIWIRYFVPMDPDPELSIYMVKIKKILNYNVATSNNLSTLKTDAKCTVPKVRNKQNKLETLTLFLKPSEEKSRIRTSLVRIRGFGHSTKPYGS
jgi:hypothetical protein